MKKRMETWYQVQVERPDEKGKVVKTVELSPTSPDNESMLAPVLVAVYRDRQARKGG